MTVKVIYETLGRLCKYCCRDNVLPNNTLVDPYSIKFEWKGTNNTILWVVVKQIY